MENSPNDLVGKHESSNKMKAATKNENSTLYSTRGTRKRAVARVTLSPGTGKVIINNTVLEDFGNEILRLRIQEPLVLAGEIPRKFNIRVNVHGGGINGQTDAIRLGIARALVEQENALRKTFTDYDRLLLVADIRRKETRKPNDSKARAKRQKSYR